MNDQILGNWVHHTENVTCMLCGAYMDIRPIWAEVALTLMCPFRCPHCSYKEVKKHFGVWSNNNGKITGLLPPRVEMSLPCLKTLIQRLKEAEIKGVLWTGGGEPTLYPYLIDAVAFASENGITSGLYTNGTYLSRDMVKELLNLQRGVEFIRISVNCVDPGCHARFHGYNTDKMWINDVLNNLTTLLVLKKELSSEVEVSVSAIFDETNIEDLPNLATTLVEAQKKTCGEIKGVLVRPIIDKTHNWRSPKVMTALDKVPYIIPEVANIFKTGGLNFYLGFSLTPDSTGEIWTKNVERPYKRCRASGWFLTVGPSLDVYVCCDKNGLDAYRIGNLQTDSIDTIWKSEQRRDVLRYINAEDCKDDICPPGCRPDKLNFISSLMESGELSFERIEEIRKQIPQNGKRIYNY